MLFVAGLLALGVGVLAYRQMDDGRPVPLLADVVTALRRDTTARRRLAGGGVFIAFEGGEGAGKSTQVAPAAGVADQRGPASPGDVRARRDAVRRRHPGDRARPRPHRHLPPRSEALLYAADRAQHVHDVLRPALDAGEVVITDRFVDSSLAYQGAGPHHPDGRRPDDLPLGDRGLQPDLTVLLDLPPEVGLARARGRAVADRLESESLEFHQRVRQTFRALAEAEPDRYLVVDAGQSPEEIAAVIRVRVAELLSGLPLQQLAQTEPERRSPPRARTIRTPRRARHRSCTREPRRGRVGAGGRPGRRRRASCAARSRQPHGDDPRLAVHRAARLRAVGGRPGVRRGPAVPRRRLTAPATPAGRCSPAPTPTCTSSSPTGCRSVRPRPASSCGSPGGRRRRAAGRSILVEDADRMTEQASNAVLKMIEEPPPRTVVMLCAPSLHPDDVPVTIRSRCRVVGLRTPPVDAIAEVLVRRDGVDPALAAWAAARPRGVTSAGPGGWPATRTRGWPARRCSTSRCRWSRWPRAWTPPTTWSAPRRRRPTWRRPRSTARRPRRSRRASGSAPAGRAWPRPAVAPASSRSWSAGRSRAPPGSAATRSTGRWSTSPASTGTRWSGPRPETRRSSTTPTGAPTPQELARRIGAEGALRRIDAVLACRLGAGAEREAADRAGGADRRAATARLTDPGPAASGGGGGVVRCSGTSAALAQSVEHLTRNEKVVGSIPTGGSPRLPAGSSIGTDPLSRSGVMPPVSNVR